MKVYLSIILIAVLAMLIPIIFWSYVNPKLYCNLEIPEGYSLFYNEKAKLYAIKKGDKFAGRYTDGGWGYTENPEPTVFTDTCEAKYFLEMAVDYFTKLKASEKRWELN